MKLNYILMSAVNHDCYNIITKKTINLYEYNIPHCLKYNIKLLLIIYVPTQICINCLCDFNQTKSSIEKCSKLN